jgi:hypothetical protein
VFYRCLPEGIAEATDSSQSGWLDLKATSTECAKDVHMCDRSVGIDAHLFLPNI